MTKSNRLGTALTAVSLIAITAGCTTPGAKFGSSPAFGGPVNSGELGLATRAQMALAANDIPTAISLAERAVERSPEDAGFRFAGSSEINANPKDTADWPKGVWTLPPTLTLKDQDREKYLAIGESDRMTLKFVKP